MSPAATVERLVPPFPIGNVPVTSLARLMRDVETAPAAAFKNPLKPARKRLVARRFVVEAFVAKKLVVVAFVVVEFRTERFVILDDAAAMNPAGKRTVKVVVGAR